jgi:hypothetical protein
MSTQTDELVDQVRDLVDMPELTVLASGDSAEKPFLLEALALQGVLLLLEHYCGAYLEAIGVDDLAKRHADASRKLLARLRARRNEPAEEDKALIAEAVEELRKNPEDDRARGRAEEAVSAILTQSGVGPARSRQLAEEISDVVVPLSDG